jgi:hypothetical protein
MASSSTDFANADFTSINNSSFNPNESKATKKDLATPLKQTSLNKILPHHNKKNPHILLSLKEMQRLQNSYKDFSSHIPSLLELRDQKIPSILFSQARSSIITKNKETKLTPQQPAETHTTLADLLHHVRNKNIHQFKWVTQHGAAERLAHRQIVLADILATLLDWPELCGLCGVQSSSIHPVINFHIENLDGSNFKKLLSGLIMPPFQSFIESDIYKEYSQYPDYYSLAKLMRSHISTELTTQARELVFDLTSEELESIIDIYRKKSDVNPLAIAKLISALWIRTDSTRLGDINAKLRRLNDRVYNEVLEHLYNMFNVNFSTDPRYTTSSIYSTFFYLPTTQKTLVNEPAKQIRPCT